jgi:hypothetical protein
MIHNRNASKQTQEDKVMTSINDDWLLYEYETLVLIKHIEKNLNQINQRYFEGNHGILSVTDNGNYVTVKRQGLSVADYDTQKLFDALENFSQEEYELSCYDLWDYFDHCKYTPQEDKKMTSNIELYEKTTIIRLLQSTLNQINQECFGEKLSVTDNGDYVTVKTQGLFVANYDIQKLWDALENYDQDNCVEFDNLWDSLDNCKYTPQEDQEIDNQLKTDNELSFSEKRQVALVDMLLGEDAITKTSISNEELWGKNRQLTNLVQNLEWENLELTQSIQEMHNLRQRENKEGSEIINHLTASIHELKQDKEYNEAWIENLKQRIHDLECTVFLLQRETNQITVLNESVTQLQIRIYQLEQENKQLKSSQLETKSEPKLTDNKAKKPKFKLPENFADYQQECNDLIDALSCFYNIKKGKWGKDILQFILTPNDTEKAKHPYPDKWKAGLYFSRRWSVDKVNLSDPDEWEDWYMDIYDFADANDIEIS